MKFKYHFLVSSFWGLGYYALALGTNIPPFWLYLSMGIRWGVRKKNWRKCQKGGDGRKELTDNLVKRANFFPMLAKYRAP